MFWAYAHHFAYMYQVAFVHINQLLMCDMDNSSDEATDEYVHIDHDVEPAGVNVCPESFYKDDG